jgi:GGDEF domain-containing protein
MFQPQKDRSPSKVRLPKQEHTPDKAALTQAKSYALEHTGTEVEVSWTEAGIGTTRSLVVKMERGKDSPNWMLWEDNGKETKIIWNYDTPDVDLINDLLLMLNRSGAGAQSAAPATQTSPQQVAKNPAPPQGSHLSTAESAHNLYLDLKGQQGSGGGSIRTSLSGMKPLNISQSEMLGGTLRQSGSHHHPSNQSELLGSIRQSGSNKNPTRITGSHENPYGSLSPETSFLLPGVATPEPALPEPEPQKPAIDPQAFIEAPSGKAAAAILKAANALNGKVIAGLMPTSPTTVEGNLDFVQSAVLLRTIAMAQLTGKLETIGEDSVGTIFFVSGEPQHAATTANSGDVAIAEIVSWQKGTFRYFVDERTAIRSINESLEHSIMDGLALLDKKKHLDSAGLTLESYLVKKQKKVADSELKVFLMKSADVDIAVQIEVYRKIGARCTLADLLRDRPMESALWIKILFNFLTCGLIDIKPPDATVRGLLDFMGEAKASVQAVESLCLRPETGIYTYPALLYFLQYEFFRYEAYNWPVTLVVMELSKRSQELESGLDLIGQQEAAVALKRIELLKRPLDILGHFETLNYALLLPNTRASQGAYLANRCLQAITSVPLSSGLDRRNVHVAFGIASIPADADDIESLLIAAKGALSKATEGDFPIVVAHGAK